MLGLRISSPVTVIEGEPYSVRLSVTNQSTRAGLPVEAQLGIGISAATEWTSLIPVQVSSEYFAPGETRTFDYTMAVPVGAGGETGQITAWVEDPTGLAIASATEDVIIAMPPTPYDLLWGEIYSLMVRRGYASSYINTIKGYVDRFDSAYWAYKAVLDAGYKDIPGVEDITDVTWESYLRSEDQLEYYLDYYDVMGISTARRLIKKYYPTLPAAPSG